MNAGGANATHGDGGPTDRARFEAFFAKATGGFRPYEWQIRVALEGFPDVLSIPTGLGKTEGAVLSWAWRRLVAELDEPLHLVYCLPMRSLVRQTVERARRYFEVLASDRACPQVSVHQLMGGAIDERWARTPDEPWMLVGTQDQLLSRALNRGYAMSRFQWPVHFGVLNQDCRWIVDEVQLMGPGLWTTAQLDWMRRKRFFALKPCLTTWMSATVGTGFLATTDRKKDGIESIQPFDSRVDQDENPELKRRRAARRELRWFEPKSGKKAPALHEQVASAVAEHHVAGSLSLVISNTVKLAQGIFSALPDSPPKILLTSRFRRCDRRGAERRLIEFEERRSQEARAQPESAGRIPNDLGLVCVSTQVVEAGLDVSAHRLWSELSPWPSVIQRLGRLNRDGRDNDALAHFWKTPKASEKRRDGEVYLGPYRKSEIESAATLISAVIGPLSAETFANVLEKLERQQSELLHDLLEPAPSPMPRAVDVHGLFSTERDVHGGFTDVSSFVRGSDPDADLTVFWRIWSGEFPPRGEDLEGLPLDPETEGCTVSFHSVSTFVKSRRARAWLWNEEQERWESSGADDLRPGMVVMLHRDVGGYSAHLGWTGNKDDRLHEVAPAGRGRALQDDQRTEIGHWTTLRNHLEDARREAERLCDSLSLRGNDIRLKPYRQAVLEAARLHDLGKTYPKWQEALPSGQVLGPGPWAKCPRVLGIDAQPGNEGLHESLEKLVLELRQSATRLPRKNRMRNRKNVLRFRWAVDQKLSREELDSLRSVTGVAWAGHVPFRPGMRHEAASALAMWKRYREGRTSYPALAVYLAAAHHGKVRTVMRATSREGNDVFGIDRGSEALMLDGSAWALDFGVAADGAVGEWLDDAFLLTDHGWTGLVADLLGPWRSQDEDRSEVGAVPAHEPRRLGPFVLAWLEALVVVADWRASEHPSERILPGEIKSGA